MKKVFKVLEILGMVLFLFYFTFLNVKIAYSCFVSWSCELSAEYQCNVFCKNECEGVMLISDWCCPPGDEYCCSLWYVVCRNGNWGRFTCYNNDNWCKEWPPDELPK